MGRILPILIGGLLFLFPATAVFAGGVEYLLYEDFDGVAPPIQPTGWLVENPNGSAQWETRQFGGGGGGGCVRYLSDALVPADDWLFSPPVELVGGTQYTLSFKYRVTSSGSPHHLAAWVGDGPSQINMSVQIIDMPIVSAEEISEATSSFTVGGPGLYHLGFHCASVPDRLAVFVDEVILSVETAEVELHLQMDKTFYGGGAIEYAVDEEKDCLVYAENVGSATPIFNGRLLVGDGNDPRAALSFLIDDPDGLDVTCKGKYKLAVPGPTDFTPLAPGESVYKYFDLNGSFYDFSKTGAYTIRAVYRNCFKLEGQPVWLGRLVSDPVTIEIQ